MEKLVRREDTEYDKKLWTGFGLFTPRGYVNPTQEQQAKMLGYTPKGDAKEFSYEYKTKDGEDGIIIKFWLQAENKAWFQNEFRLVNKPVIAKESGKQQFVCQVGGDFGSYWIDDEKNLPDWFTHYQRDKQNVADKVYRAAIQGEANLYQFLNVWYAHVDWMNPDSTLLLDIKRLFRNVDKYVKDEYQPLLDQQNQLDDEANSSKKDALRKEIMVEPVVALATVYTGEDKDGAIVHYQKLYQSYLSHWKMKKISFAISSGNWNDKDLKNYHKQLTGEKGCRDAYSLTLLKPFDPNDHIQCGPETFKVDTSDVSDTSY